MRRKLATIKTPVKVAVMGCVVNGPGEAEGADVAVFAGRQRGIIYVQGEQKRRCPHPGRSQGLHTQVESHPGPVIKSGFCLQLAV